MYICMYIYIYISCDQQQNEDMVRNVEIPLAFRGLGCPRNGELIHQNPSKSSGDSSGKLPSIQVCHQFFGQTHDLHTEKVLHPIISI